MRYIYNILLFISLVGFIPKVANATHGMGGEITWYCQGSGDYVFELKFYRDCNGFEVNTNFETIEVWGHPTLTSIQVDFQNRKDISPQCTASAGNSPFECGNGVSGGNGVGAVEEITYRSAPISIPGVPPSRGWDFTYQNFSRSGALTNIQNPTSLGITLTASMFPIPGATGGCIDNSPTFLQSPHIVSCTGAQYDYNPNGVDVDLDSLHFSWGKPLDHFTSGIYTPPTSPAPIPFEAGFSFDNPTPDANLDVNNEAATINPENGRIQFKSFTQGNFATKIVVDSYRNGVKIATIEREIQLIVATCGGTNDPPVITPPFAGGTSFETTIFAGDPISFDIIATDVENLQGGTPQSVSISSSGLMYGAGFTDPNNGCITTTPCATINTPTVTSINGATMHFDWQTSCDHLVGATGNALDEVPYVFVFKIQDDYCPIPQVRYATVTIILKNKEVLPPANITCITNNAAGDMTVHWTPITDPFGTFAGYEIGGVDGGIYGNIANINASSFTIPAGAGPIERLFVHTKSGCGGASKRSSDTLSNILLDLNNPGNGQAVLQWNNPYPTQLPSFNDNFHIYKEYPAGTWTLIDSVPYNTTVYYDTITVCEEFISYQIVLPTSSCEFSSNIEGDMFEDKIVPDIPVITNVDIDTLTGDITVLWNENAQNDTYGYVIYQTDQNGNLVEIDTVWGKPNTNFTHAQNHENGPFRYSIAAFDSCYTANIPPTYQTSAKAEPHTTNLLSTSLDVCNRLITFKWTGYIGFNNNENHILYTRVNNGPWQQAGQTIENNISVDINVGDEVIGVIQTISDQDESSFSNVDTLNFIGSQGPDISYLSVATVEKNNIAVKYRITHGQGANKVELERFNERNQSFEKIDEKIINNLNGMTFIDSDVEVNKRSYTYRAKIIDTCNQFLGYSNIGQTIHLNVITKQETEAHVLQWSPYDRFIGNLHSYEIYRAINDQYDPTPIATLPYNIRTYTDSVSSLGNFEDGKICYTLVAIEGENEYGLAETSYSNEACGIISPTIYIPNAFTVGGYNPVFKPETRQRQFENYLFEVYDRYGRVIFSTKDPSEGWNGQLKGQKRIAREGVYVYRLSLRDGNGIEIIKHGHVTLLDYRGVE
ncbi:MAG TPA: gliding motility-associated C-terminal domain-containing protein [Brumimicrobium sp.]|nr:gliding motility-associated C-terminal domain-containing protein [Brumimicrobium sp.]